MTDRLAIEIALVPTDDDDLTIGLVPTEEGLLKVGMMFCGTLMLMTPKMARQFAKKFRRPDVKAAGLGFVYDHLTEAAASLDAMSEAEQRRRVSEVLATLNTKGTV